MNWETGKTKPKGRRLDLVQMFLRGKLPDGLLTHLADAEEVDLMAYPMMTEGEQD